MLKRKLYKVIFLINILLFCSCNENNGVKNDTVTFIDALNREVTVEKNPETVATLLGSFADIWVLSGGEVKATTEEAWDDFNLELDAVNLGNAHSQSAEKLLSVAPDFVIASAKTASNLEMRELLETVSVPVAYFDVDNFEDYLEMLRICTDITGRKDLYQKNGLDFQKRIDNVKHNFSKFPDNEKTALLIRTSATSVKAKGSSGTVLGEMLSDLGFINIADNDNSLLENLSLESIIKENPYSIFVVTMGDDYKKAVENLKKTMDENPAWQTLDAVKNKRVYLMDKTLFNLKPNGRWAEAYEVLFETIQ